MSLTDEAVVEEPRVAPRRFCTVRPRTTWTAWVGSLFTLGVLACSGCRVSGRGWLSRDNRETASNVALVATDDAAPSFPTPTESSRSLSLPVKTERGGSRSGGEAGMFAKKPATDSQGETSAAALTAVQLAKVVEDYKAPLRRCYEAALRAAHGVEDPAVKLRVAVVVSRDGSVRSLTTDGESLGALKECIRASVRRWRFPQSSAELEVAFPLVFLPG